MMTITTVSARSRPTHTDFRTVIAMGTAKASTKDGKMIPKTLMSELWIKPLTVIGHGWGPLNLFRTAIETGTVAASAKNMRRRITGGEIATIMMVTDIDRLAMFRRCQLSSRP